MRHARDDRAGGDEQFRVLSAAMDDAVITIDAASVILSANDAVEKIFGWRPTELVGQSLTVLMPEEHRQRHLDGFRRYLETGARHRSWSGFEVEGLHRGGRVLVLEVKLAENRKDDTFLGIIRDLTARFAAARRLEVEHDVTRFLSEAESIDEAVPKVLETIGEHLGLASCELWLADDGGAPRLTSARGGEISDGSLAREVHESAAPRFTGDAMAFPVLAGPRAIGALVGSGGGLREGEPELLAMLAAMGRQIGQFVERRRAEEALRHDEARLALLVRQVPALLYTTDASLVITSTQGRLLAQLGLTPGDMIGRRPYDEVAEGHPQPGPQARQSHERALAGQTVFYSVAAGERQLEVRLEPLRDARERIVGVVGVVLDVSDRFRSEATLRAIAHAASNVAGPEFFRALVQYLARELQIDCAFVGETIPGVAGRVRSIAFCVDGKLLEPVEYDLAGTPCADLWMHGVTSCPRDLLRRYPEDHLARSLGMTSYVGAPLYDSEHRPLGVIAVLGRSPMVAPATVESVLRIFAARVASELERKHREAALRESELRYRALFEGSPSPTFLVDPESDRLLAANHAAETAYGWSALELASMRMSDLRATGDETSEGTERHRRRDGSVLEVEISAHGVRIEGRAARVVIARDVTHRRRLERELHQAQKMEAVGRLAGGVAHDFNNLLTAIITMSELALSEPLPDLLGEDLRHIHEAAVRGSNLTRQLLAFSRRQVLRPTLTDLNAVITELSKMLRRLIGEDIELELRLDAGLDATRVDAAQMEQVIVNLALNAREAMPRGGRLTIETVNATSEGLPGSPPAGEYVRLAMTDSGHGMEPAVLARLFEPFFSTRGRTGRGLGLSTAYGIVRQSQGHIFARSEPGRGTTFEIFLPRAVRAAPAVSRNGDASAAPGGTETVLLVEDDDAVRRVAKRILSSWGYRVLAAADAADALRLCVEHSDAIDLLLTDVVMPQMGGRELAERAVEICPGIRVLFMSGYTDDAVVRHGVYDGLSAFLQKPFTAEALARKVREVLESS